MLLLKNSICCFNILFFLFITFAACMFFCPVLPFMTSEMWPLITVYLMSVSLHGTQPLYSLNGGSSVCMATGKASVRPDARSIKDKAYLESLLGVGGGQYSWIVNLSPVRDSKEWPQIALAAPWVFHFLPLKYVLIIPPILHCFGEGSFKLNLLRILNLDTG